MDGNQTPHDQPAAEGQLQPGVTITPGMVISGDAATSLPPTQPPAPATQPVTVPELTPVAAATAPPPEVAVPQQPVTAAPQSVEVPKPAQPPMSPEAVPVAAPVQNAYQQPPRQPFASEDVAASSPEDFSAVPSHASDQPAAVSWTASEFIAHHKTPTWYAGLFGVAVVVAALIWLLTRDIFSSVVVIVAVGMLAAYASRSPRELRYAVDDNGITIGEKQYAYSSFRSFSVIEDGAFSSIEFMPLKRFSPPTTIYYDPNDEDAIAGAIARHLPFENRQRDAIDALMHKIRF